MSGMAGNVSAFSAVWTYDIYQPHIVKNAKDEHYVLVGRWAPSSAWSSPSAPRTWS
jgi:solute:Na+ symporter, SSS family